MSPRRDDESGIALIAAMFAVLILFGFSVLFVALAQGQNRATGAERDHETSVHAAEAGTDLLIAAVNAETDSDGDGVFEPHVTETDGSPHIYDSSCESETGIDRHRCERSWAIALAEDPDATPMDLAEGQAFGIRPCNDGDGDGSCDTTASGEIDARDEIYGVAFVPCRDADDDHTCDDSGESVVRANVRAIKLQFDRVDFSPDFAFQTDAGVELGGNASVLDPTDCDPSVTNPNDPNYCDANVHANGDITGSGSSTEVQGTVSSTGSVSAGGTYVDTVENTSPEKVPEITAREMHSRGPGEATEPWHDLCPGNNGSIRAYSSAGPCQGTIEFDNVDTTPALGWSYDAKKDLWRSTSINPGVWYVYRSSVDVTGSAHDPTSATILAEKLDGETSGSGTRCRNENTNSGNICVSGNTSLRPALRDTQLVADRDVDLGGTAGGNCGESGLRLEGLVYGGEQLRADGTVDLNGAMIAGEDPHTPPSPVDTTTITGTMCLTFDDSLEVPITGLIRVTAWNELLQN